jgi:hypothetical protein
MNKILKAARSRSALVGASLMAVGMGAAQAAVDISAETAAAKTDIATAGALIVGVVVAIAVIGWVRKVVH